MDKISCKLLVIGAGPGGYVCAIRAGQLGVDTVIVDTQKPGGTCLNVGCIPSKALIHAADEFHRVTRATQSNALGISVSEPRIDLARTIAWKDGIVQGLNTGVAGLLKKARVRLIQGHAQFINGKSVTVQTSDGAHHITAEHIVIATGSEPVELPFLPFGGNVLSSTQVLALPRVPASVAVVGAGYIGLELGIALRKLGSAVTIIEGAPQILPIYDAELVRPVSKRLQELGIRVLTDTQVKARDEDGALVCTVKGQEDRPEKISTEQILVTIGRQPRTQGYALESLSLAMQGRFIRIDARCRTSMQGVYAIGDVTGEPMLAHRAMAQGELVAETIAGHPREWDKRCIPAVCFTDPEILSVGLLPSQEAGSATVTGTFPFQANGRAMTMEQVEGFVRIIARADNHVILGIQAVGAGVSELSAAFTLAIESGLRLEDVSGTIHAHPTLGEAFQEAALRALGQALHI